MLAALALDDKGAKIGGVWTVSRRFDGISSALVFCPVVLPMLISGVLATQPRSS